MDVSLLWCPTLLALLHTAAATTRVEEHWVLQRSNTAGLNHMVMHRESGKLYVAAVNKLFVFDGDLKAPYEVQTGPVEDSVNCAPLQFRNKLAPCTNLTLTPVYNKGLVIDYTNGRLITCANIYHGACEKRYLDNVLYKEEDDSQLIPVVNNDPKASTVLLIAPGPLLSDNGEQTEALYVAAQRSRLGPMGFNYKIPAFASRKMTDFHLVNADLTGKTEIIYESNDAISASVQYKYGFSSQGFSYMIVVQKANLFTDNFISKLFRVCQNDMKFTSYAEIPLQCEAGGVVYNLAQAAYLGRPGASLARELGVPVTEDVLYAVFSKSFDNSSNPVSQSALCVYPMRHIRRTFTQNIRACFEGRGNTGPANVMSPHPCREVDLDINDDYCGDHDVNYPIEGGHPVTAIAAVTFNVTATAITVVDGQDYTEALVGTAGGHLMKVILKSRTDAVVYDDVILDDGSQINADMFLDRDENYVYVMTDFKIVKVSLRDWRMHATCRQCRGVTGDPYCDLCDVSEGDKYTVKDSDNSSQHLAVSSLSFIVVLILGLS